MIIDKRNEGVFIDAAGWEKYINFSNPEHNLIKSLIENAPQRIITTKEELLSLSYSSSKKDDIAKLVNTILISKAIGFLLSPEEEDYELAWKIYEHFDGKEPSFSECLSFSIIEQYKIRSWITSNKLLRRKISFHS